jgi:hypothetical protein
MNEVLIVSLLGAIVSLVPCALIAYVIGVKQHRHILAGYDESKINNPEAYARVIALGVFCMGILMALIFIIWGLGGFSLGEFISALLLASFSLIPFLFFANSKYKKRLL